MPTLLLTVADAFELTGRGTLLAPPLSLGEFRPGNVEVELRDPGGAAVRTVAHLQVIHLARRPPAESAWELVVVLDLPKSSTPPGTEVWAVSELPT